MSEKITVLSDDSVVMRKGGAVPREIDVDVLAQNVNIFMGQIEKIIDSAPEETGKFRLTEFTVSASISAKGALMIMGSGAEVTGSGGLTFKFERK